MVLVDLSQKMKDWTSDRMGGARQASVISQPLTCVGS
jgi:hypothetical protein